MTNGTDFLRLSNNFSIGFARPSVLEMAQFGDLGLAIEDTKYLLAHDRHQRLVVGRGEADRNLILNAPELQSLTLSLIDHAKPTSQILTISQQANLPYEQQDESYELDIPSEGTATLEANTILGLLRGLQTFSQLVYELPFRHRRRAFRYVADVPIWIRDKPAFPHRALMLDTSRNFFPVADILRTLKAMSYAKLNVFHWHATDSQSWPLFVPSLPRLNEKAAYSPSETYSRSDILHIQEYANARGISVLLEVDVPGHTASVAKLHPEHVACLDKDDSWPQYAAEPPTGQLRLSEQTTRFTGDIIDSVADMMKSPYFSTGGDEVNDNCYLEDEPTRTEMQRRGDVSLDALLSDFVGSVHAGLKAAQKTPVVWEEMVLNHNLSLSQDTIVTVWISSANVRAVAEAGFRVIHAASDYFYLDCGAGGWIGNVPGGGNSWCDPFKSWQKIYSFDPYANVTESQRKQILGGEALLWAEQADPTNLDPMTWPRAAAAAEVFWTGDRINGNPRDGREALPRLHDWRYRMRNRGIRAAPLQPHACALRPNLCDKI
ncbi:hypothetical protein ACM66B_000835 [Microbotryomycetes sp. NB124-2]